MLPEITIPLFCPFSCSAFGIFIRASQGYRRCCCPGRNVFRDAMAVSVAHDVCGIWTLVLRFSTDNFICHKLQCARITHCIIFPPNGLVTSQSCSWEANCYFPACRCHFRKARLGSDITLSSLKFKWLLMSRRTTLLKLSPPPPHRPSPFLRLGHFRSLCHFFNIMQNQDSDTF